MAHNLKAGDKVQVNREIPGSYLSKGLYLVEEIGKRDVYWRNMARNSSTADPHWLVNKALETGAMERV